MSNVILQSKKLTISLFQISIPKNSWNFLTSFGEHKDVVSTESKESDVEEDEETLRRNIFFDIVSSMDTRKGCFFGLQWLIENGWFSICIISCTSKIKNFITKNDKWLVVEKIYRSKSIE